MRRFIFAAVFFLVAFAQNLAFALNMNEVDWSGAPTVSSREELVKYILQCEENFQTEIPVIFAKGLNVNQNEFFANSNLNLGSIVYRVMFTTFSTNNQISRAFYQLEYYPGAKVAYAYRTNNPSILTGDEKKLYNLAVQIVNEAKIQPTALRRELFIHDAITSRATYYNDIKKMGNDKPMPRFVTAAGALIDGRANCQGYSDAFFMLGNMCGFNVGKISGVTHSDTDPAQSENHMWNTIKFDNGKTYFVDVTWNDDSFKFSKKLGYNSYIYFNAPTEVAAATHSWDGNLYWDLQTEPDDYYFFTTPEFDWTDGEYFGSYAPNANIALGDVAKRIAVHKKKLSWVMIPYDGNFNGNKVINKLARELLPQRYQYRRGTYTMGYAQRGKYMFLVFDVRSMKK